MAHENTLSNPSAASDFDLVDALGIAKATVALHSAIEKRLSDELKRRYERGGAVSAGFYDATIALTPGKETLDKEYVKSHMHPNAYRRALKVGDPYLCVKVVAKKRKAS